MKSWRVVALPALALLAAALFGDAGAGFVLPATTLTGSPVEPEAYFGWAVAAGDIDDDGFDDVLVSAPYRDVEGHVSSGEVYLFAAPSLSPGPVLQHPDEEGTRFGHSIATGDFNGDGMDDVLVGAPYSDVSGQVAAGSAVVFYGPTLTASLTVDNPFPAVGAHFGSAVAAADVNNDGRDDLLVGAPDAIDGGMLRAGRAYVFLAPSFTAVFALHDPEPEGGAHFGRAIEAGDIDGDGDEDVIVGAPESDIGLQILDCGQAFVFRAPQLTALIALQDPEPQSGAFFGRSLAGGDFDADGDDDVMIGAYGSELRTHPTAGQVFIFDAPVLSAVTVLEEPITELDAYFGFALTAADVNDDGYEDAVIGAHDADVGNFAYTSGGEAYVFHGPSFAPIVRLEDPVLESFAFFARAVAVGDVNDDGRGDFIAGGPWSDVSGSLDAGEAFVFLAEPDADHDYVADAVDNCPLIFNPDQLNSDSQPIDNGTTVAGDDVTVPSGDWSGDLCDGDNDNDGLPDLEESDSACPFRLIRDSDGDGSLDGYERSGGSDPCLSTSRPPLGPTTDSDGDGLNDGLEARGWGTSPLLGDTDGDGCDDDKEAASVNADRQANLTDVLWVARAAFAVMPCHSAFDISRSGMCELSDAVLAARNSTLVEAHPPCPAP